MNVRNRTPLTTLVPRTDIDVLQKVFFVPHEIPEAVDALVRSGPKPHKYIGHGQVSTLTNEF